VAVPELVIMLSATFSTSLTSAMPAKASLPLPRHIVPTSNGLYPVTFTSVSPSRASLKWRCSSLPSSYHGECFFSWGSLVLSSPHEL